MKQYAIPLYNRLSKKADTSYSSVGNGVTIIPNISGYTTFVHNTNHLERKSITSQLLLSILEHNNLELKVAEIKGNAVLFYKYGAPPSATAILKQYKYMLEGFQEKREQLSNQFHMPLALSLKLIAHYGAIAEYKMGGFEKLHGEAIIVAYRLLKNSINSHSYALLTDELLKAIPANQQKEVPLGLDGSKLCEVYGDLRSICFTYFDYEYKMTKETIA